MNGIRKAFLGGILATALALAWPAFGSAQSSSTPAQTTTARLRRQARRRPRSKRSSRPQAKPAVRARRNPRSPPTVRRNSQRQRHPTPPLRNRHQPRRQPASSTPSAATTAPAATTPTDTTGETQKNIKPGSEQDVNAIGNREVGNGVNLYSLAARDRARQAGGQEVEKTARLINDPVVTEYMNRVGQNLVRNSDAKVPFTIKVIDSDEINAFALPGGFFYVNSGLILRADEEAELAGVMGHEIAHVCARHGTRTPPRAN